MKIKVKKIQFLQYPRHILNAQWPCVSSCYHMDSSGAEADPGVVAWNRNLSGGSFHQNCAYLDTLKHSGSKLISPKRDKYVLLGSNMLLHKFPDDRDTRFCLLFSALPSSGLKGGKLLLNPHRSKEGNHFNWSIEFLSAFWEHNDLCICLNLTFKSYSASDCREGTKKYVSAASQRPRFRECGVRSGKAGEQSSIWVFAPFPFFNSPSSLLTLVSLPLY